MWYYLVKIILSATVLVAISELVKRSSLLAAALASLPLTSLLAFVWIYLESGDVQKIAALSQDIFWLVLPSLLLFIILPLMLRCGLGFWLSLASAAAVTALGYLATVKLLHWLGLGNY